MKLCIVGRAGTVQEVSLGTAVGIKSGRLRWMPLAERLFGRATAATNGCWEWQGMLSGRDQYGLIRVDGQRRVVHRVAYELLVGPIPTGFVLDHLCRNRICINPDHVEVVTNGENVLRGEGPFARNGRKTHCVRGHPLAGDNLAIDGGRQPGKRRCRECARARTRAYRSRRRAAVPKGVEGFQIHGVHTDRLVTSGVDGMPRTVSEAP